ncbi:MAG: tetratricopeptide repeat protein, partial [bacterium]|nr:tetratricopeptide repeat protein [bacterium]
MKSKPTLFVLATMCASLLSAQESPAAATPPSSPQQTTSKPAVAVSEQFKERATLAEGLFRRKFYEMAAVEFEVLVKETPADTPLGIDFTLRLAECYAKTNRIAQAKKLYNQVSGSPIVGDHRATARLRLAKLFREAGDNEMAVPFLETVVSDEKCSPDLRLSARIELAQVFVQLQRYQQAIKHYQELITTSKEHEVLAKMALIRIYNEQKAFSTAMDLCEEVMQHPKASAADIEDVAVFGFSVACQEEDYPRAVNFTKNQNKAAFPRMTVAWVLLKTGDAEHALEWLSDDKAANPKASPERLSLEIAICEALKDQAGALTACERLLAEFPNAREAKSAAATMLVLRARQGQPAAFLEAYKRVQERYLSNETKLALAPYRLDAALRTKDVLSARAAAALLEEKGSPEQAADALYRVAWMEQEKENWAAAGEAYLDVAEKWPTASIAGRAAYAAAYA